MASTSRNPPMAPQMENPAQMASGEVTMSHDVAVPALEEEGTGMGPWNLVTSRSRRRSSGAVSRGEKTGFATTSTPSSLATAKTQAGWRSFGDTAGEQRPILSAPVGRKLPSSIGSNGDPGPLKVRNPLAGKNKQQRPVVKQASKPSLKGPKPRANPTPPFKKETPRPLPSSNVVVVRANDARSITEKDRNMEDAKREELCMLELMKLQDKGRVHSMVSLLESVDPLGSAQAYIDPDNIAFANTLRERALTLDQAKKIADTPMRNEEQRLQATNGVSNTHNSSPSK